MAATAHTHQTQAQKTVGAAAAAAAVVMALINSPPIQQVGPGSMHGPLWHLRTFERPLYRYLNWHYILDASLLSPDS